MENNRKIATCEICFEEKLAVNASIYKKNTKCSKPHYFCQDCMASHIQFKLQAKNAVIRCPGIECNATLSPVKCCSIITRDSFVEWCDILADTWVAHKGHRRAVCPYEGCSEVVTDECRGGGRQECPRCKGVFCFGCGAKWSENHPEGCRFEELVFLNAARQGNWKRCPNCRFFVQRTDGCNVITCRCGAVFCYKCGCQTCRCLFWHCLCYSVVIMVIILLWFAIIFDLIYATHERSGHK